LAPSRRGDGSIVVAAGRADRPASSKRSQLVDRASIHGEGLVLVVPGDPGCWIAGGAP